MYVQNHYMVPYALYLLGIRLLRAGLVGEGLQGVSQLRALGITEGTY